MVISNDIRNRLNKYASKYYSTEKNGNREEVNEVCRKIGIYTHGWDCIGNGSGRNVFDMSIFGYPNLALKLAIPDQEYGGIKQNKYEFKMWNTLNNQQKEYLAPVLESGHNNYWLIMPKGKSIHVDYNWLDNAIYYLKDSIWEDDIQEVNIVSIKGEPKICDYGTPPP